MNVLVRIETKIQTRKENNTNNEILMSKKPEAYKIHQRARRKKAERTEISTFSSGLICSMARSRLQGAKCVLHPSYVETKVKSIYCIVRQGRWKKK